MMFYNRHNISSLLCCFVVVLAATTLDFTAARRIKSISEVERYLKQFGYLPGSRHTSSLVTPSTWQQAIKDFQEFNGLDETGRLDAQTLRLMSTRRCGVRDKKSGAHSEYSLLGTRWPIKNITYRVSKYTKQIPEKDIDEQMRKAFSIWSEHTDLIFTPKLSGRANIDIRFEKYEHGDSDPFDGPGKVVGHANAPNPETYIHLDDSERWTVDSWRGINLLIVAAHEIGHALGLEHSSIKSALMAPSYQSYKPDFALHPDDIRGIQSLYGKRTKKSPIKPKPTSDEPEYDEDEEDEDFNDSNLDDHTDNEKSEIDALDDDYEEKLDASGNKGKGKSDGKINGPSADSLEKAIKSEDKTRTIYDKILFDKLMKSFGDYLNNQKEETDKTTDNSKNNDGRFKDNNENVHSPSTNFGDYAGNSGVSGKHPINNYPPINGFSHRIDKFSSTNNQQGTYSFGHRIHNVPPQMADFLNGNRGFNDDNGDFNNGNAGFSDDNGSYDNDNGGFNNGHSGFSIGDGGFNNGKSGFNDGNSGFNDGNGRFHALIGGNGDNCQGAVGGYDNGNDYGSTGGYRMKYQYSNYRCQF